MTPFKATVFLAVGLCMFGSFLHAQEKDEDSIRVYKRLIPADVLRGMQQFCFLLILCLLRLFLQCTFCFLFVYCHVYCCFYFQIGQFISIVHRRYFELSIKLAI